MVTPISITKDGSPPPPLMKKGCSLNAEPLSLEVDPEKGNYTKIRLKITLCSTSTHFEESASLF